MSSWRIMMFPSIGTQLELYQLQLQNLNNGLVLVLHLSHSNGRHSQASFTEYTFVYCIPV